MMLTSGALDTPKTPKLVRHRSPESITRAFFKGAGVSGSVWDWEMLPGIPFVAQVRGEGYWAFAATRENVIHLWHDGKQTEDTLRFLLGHELGHIADVYAMKMRRGDRNGEARADLYGWVAQLAFQWAARST